MSRIGIALPITVDSSHKAPPPGCVALPANVMRELELVPMAPVAVSTTNASAVMTAWLSMGSDKVCFVRHPSPFKGAASVAIEPFIADSLSPADLVYVQAANVLDAPSPIPIDTCDPFILRSVHSASIGLLADPTRVLRVSTPSRAVLAAALTPAPLVGRRSFSSTTGTLAVVTSASLLVPCPDDDATVPLLWTSRPLLAAAMAAALPPEGSPTPPQAAAATLPPQLSRAAVQVAQLLAMCSPPPGSPARIPDAYRAAYVAGPTGVGKGAVVSAAMAAGRASGRLRAVVVLPDAADAAAVARARRRVAAALGVPPQWAPDGATAPSGAPDNTSVTTAVPPAVAAASAACGGAVALVVRGAEVARGCAAAALCDLLRFVRGVATAAGAANATAAAAAAQSAPGGTGPRGGAVTVPRGVALRCGPVAVVVVLGRVGPDGGSATLQQCVRDDPVLRGAVTHVGPPVALRDRAATLAFVCDALSADRNGAAAQGGSACAGAAVIPPLDVAAYEHAAASCTGYTVADAERAVVAAASEAAADAWAAGTDPAASWARTLARTCRRLPPAAVGAYELSVPHLRWDDIAGQAPAKAALARLVASAGGGAVGAAQHGRAKGGGVLLYGPPGCSKTMLAKAVASAAGVNFLAVKGPALLSRWVGASEQAVAALFATARAVAPTVIFLDEADALCAARGSTGVSSLDRVVGQLLVEMDGLVAAPHGSASDGGSGVGGAPAVQVIAATNRPDLIDPAILRPGRLGTHVLIGLPDPDARRAIVEMGLAQVGDHAVTAADVDAVVAATERFSGAETAVVVRAAAQAALEEAFIAASVAPSEHAQVTSDSDASDASWKSDASDDDDDDVAADELAALLRGTPSAAVQAATAVDTAFRSAPLSMTTTLSVKHLLTACSNIVPQTSDSWIDFYARWGRGE